MAINSQQTVIKWRLPPIIGAKKMQKKKKARDRERGRQAETVAEAGTGAGQLAAKVKPLIVVKEATLAMHVQALI